MYSGSDFIKKTQKRFTFPKEEQRFYYWEMYILFDRDYCKAIVSTESDILYTCIRRQIDQ